jgi:hypothetical protein
MNGAVALFLMVDFPTLIFTTLQYSYVSKFLMVTIHNASKLCTIGFSVPDPKDPHVFRPGDLLPDPLFMSLYSLLQLPKGKRLLQNLSDLR